MSLDFAKHLPAGITVSERPDGQIMFLDTQTNHTVEFAPKLRSDWVAGVSILLGKRLHAKYGEAFTTSYRREAEFLFSRKPMPEDLVQIIADRHIMSQQVAALARLAA